MIRRLREILKRHSRDLGTAFTLIALVGVGYLGHRLTSHAHEGDSTHQSQKPPLPVVNTPQSADARIVRFPSIEMVRSLGITTIDAQLQPVSEDIQANGVLDYDQKSVARISSLVPGTIWRVEKFRGDPVVAGDVLAIIEASEVGRMKAEFLTALLSTNSNQETLSRLEEGADAIPQRQVRQARFSLGESRIRLLNSEQALVNLGLNVRIENFQGLSDTKQVELLHFVGLPASIAKTLDPNTTTSNLVPIVAPLDGVVVTRSIGRGEVVEPAKLLMQIADIRHMWISLQVQKEDASKVAIGQEVFFWVDGLDEQLTSRLSWISTEVDQDTRTLEVRAKVENKIAHPNDPSATGQRLLRAHTYGTGVIRLQTKLDAIVVPHECIHTIGHDSFVFVRTSDTTFESRFVDCGIDTGKHMEIRGNVAVGDEIAQKGSHILKSQVLLTILKSQSP